MSRDVFSFTLSLLRSHLSLLVNVRRMDMSIAGKGRPSNLCFARSSTRDKDESINQWIKTHFFSFFCHWRETKINKSITGRDVLDDRFFLFLYHTSFSVRERQIDISNFSFDLSPLYIHPSLLIDVRDKPANRSRDRYILHTIRIFLSLFSSSRRREIKIYR